MACRTRSIREARDDKVGPAGAASAEKGEKLLAAISADVAEALLNERLWSEPI